MSQAEIVGLTLAGLIAPFLTQLLKKANLSNRLAHLLSLGVALGLAFVALLVTGGLSFEPLEQLAVRLSYVVALGSIVYNQLIKDNVQPILLETGLED